MKAHWQYLKSVCRHKWFVFLACFQMGVPIWSAILHDWDKFLPDEWLPYANYFYGIKGKKRGADGTYQRTSDEDPAFDRAWLLHQKRNKHHWQWWILNEDSGKVKLFPMPDLARREMLADWMGAGRAYVPNWTPLETGNWYEKNKDKMQLHPETRAWVEAQLAYLKRNYEIEQRLKSLGVIS